MSIKIIFGLGNIGAEYATTRHNAGAIVLRNLADLCSAEFVKNKFCNADIKKVIYGKVEFVKHSDGETYPENPAIYDVTSLYYLNNLVGAMEAPSCSEAQKALDAFFNI